MEIAVAFSFIVLPDGIDDRGGPGRVAASLRQSCAYSSLRCSSQKLSVIAVIASYFSRIFLGTRS
jgi:hypothetical protein